MEKALPPIPAKRYFTIGEVGDLCGVKPHVLRYWEQEFTQLRPMKRRGNRRYYQHHEVLMIRRIRDLLYDQGFTISGARNKLQELIQMERERRRNGESSIDGVDVLELDSSAFGDSQFPESAFDESAFGESGYADFQDMATVDEPLDLATRLQLVRRELSEIRELLSVAI